MTQEDLQIWMDLGAPGRGWTFFMPADYWTSDRLDAKLMLQILRSGSIPIHLS